jgi:hypothetical protein
MSIVDFPNKEQATRAVYTSSKFATSGLLSDEHIHKPEGLSNHQIA